MTGEFQRQSLNNATDRAVAVEKTSGERWCNIDIDIIRRAFDPWECPEHLLPFLAYQRSVDLWDHEWPVAKKRQAIARAPRLHRIKGTEAAIREVVEFMGGEVLNVIVPPQTLFASPKLTEEERREFLARYPQLRIYPHRGKTTVPRRAFFAGHSYAGENFVIRSDAEARVTPRVFVWDKGDETEQTTVTRIWTEETVEAEQAIQVRRKITGPKRKLYAGKSYAGNTFPIKSTASNRVYTLRTRQDLVVPGQEKLALRVAVPSLDFIDVWSERVFERYSPAKSFFAGGRSHVGHFLRPSTAADRVYHRLYLLDPTRNPTSARGKAIFYAGHSRIGMPPFNAEFKVRIRYKRPKRAFHAGQILNGRFAVKGDKRALYNVTAAFRSHKRAAEKHLISIRTVAPVTAGVGTIAGTVTAGQLVEINS